MSQEFLIELSSWTLYHGDVFCVIEEITAFYNSVRGTLSFGIMATDHVGNVHKKFYPNIFKGLRDQIEGPARIYLAITGIFGCFFR